MTTPADELRTAADKLRTLAADATHGPWHVHDPSIRWGDDHDHRLVGGGKILAKFNSGHNGPLNSDYAAAMHPDVGAALADWLELFANTEFDPAATVQVTDRSHECALAVARAILGEQP